MLKLIAILVLIYFFFRSVGYIIRLLIGGGASTQRHNPYTSQQKRQTKEGLNIDNVPKDQKKRKDFRGGDYVDYEEVE